MPKGKGTYGKQVGKPKKKKVSSNSILNKDCFNASGGSVSCADPQCTGSDCENPT